MCQRATMRSEKYIDKLKLQMQMTVICTFLSFLFFFIFHSPSNSVVIIRCCHYSLFFFAIPFALFGV